QKVLGFLSGSWITAKPRRRVNFGIVVQAEAGLINHPGRYRRCDVQRDYVRPPRDRAGKASRIRPDIVGAVVHLVRVAELRLVLGAESVLIRDVLLLGVAEKVPADLRVVAVVAIPAALPAELRDIQAVAAAEVSRVRREIEDLFHVARRVWRWAKRVPQTVC